MVEPVAVWWRLAGAHMRSQLQYRASFALDFVGSFLISFVDFVAVLVVFHNTPRLNTWDTHEVALLYALSSISFGLTDLLIGHLDQFPQKIRDGNFDILLVRPRGTLFQIIGSDLALRRIAKALQGGLVLVYALSQLDIRWDAASVTYMALAVPTGIVIFGSVWVVGACIAFWTVDGGEFTNAFTYGGNFMTQYPVDVYATWLRRFLAYVVPLAFVTYFPALVILGKDDPLGLPRVLDYSSPLVAVISAVVAGTIWRSAVRHYRSAGG